jgi:integrase
VRFLREKKGFGPDDPLFPKTKVEPGEDLAFHAVSLDRAPWANANPVRKIFRETCMRAAFPYFNPHLLRNTLVQVAYDRKLDAEAFKAWSQNLGHESCLTTFSSYGTIPPARQAEIIRRLAVDDGIGDVSSQAEMLRTLADRMQRRGSPWPAETDDRRQPDVPQERIVFSNG